MNVAFLEPVVAASGPEGGRFMKRLVHDRKLSLALGLSSLIAIVSGVLLYWRTSLHLNRDWIGTDVGIGFTVGGIAGLIAFFFGLLYIAPAAGRLSELGRQVEAGGGPPAPELLAKLHATQAKLRLGGLIELPVIVFASAAMAIARYL